MTEQVLARPRPFLIRGTKLPKALLALLVVGLIAAVPLLPRTLGILLPGPLNSVGTLSVLSIVLVTGALAMTLYVLIGMTGLLSIGHSLYFGMGMYGTVVLVNEVGLAFGLAGLLAVIMTAVVAVLANALALRTGMVAYTMITLAFGQLAWITVERGFLWTGGSQGLSLSPSSTPEIFRGIANARNVYWLALTLVITLFVVLWFLERRTLLGQVWSAIRENNLRAESMGFSTYGYQLAATVIGSTLAGVCGVVYALVVSGAQPEVTHIMYSLALVLMVVLGGRGSIGGALLGGALYTFCTLRLPTIAMGSSIQDLPGILRIPLSQPDFLLGVLFIAIIMFMPGGLFGGIQALGHRLSRARTSRKAEG